MISALVGFGTDGVNLSEQTDRILVIEEFVLPRPDVKEVGQLAHVLLKLFL